MKRLFALLASLKLAVILLALLLVGLSAGTIVESRMGVETAGHLVYYAPWFLALQGLFAINVALSLADLFPWTKQRTGFVVLHASLLVIIAGAAITYFGKVEGTLALWEGQSGALIEERNAAGSLISSHELPFSVQLDAFVLETYPGTSQPAGYRSQVQITDSGTGKSFPAQIWMNHELHHRGYALFQSSYRQEEGRQGTVLAVSKDPGQSIVFAGFITLILGMIIVLATRIAQARGAQAGRAQLGKALLVLALLAGATAARAAPQPAAPDPEQLRRLPVQHDGRVMPLDTLAREMVWTVTGASTWQGQDPVATISTWCFDPANASALPLVKIGSRALAEALALPPGTTHASFAQLAQNPAFEQWLRAAHQAEEEGRPLHGLLQDAAKLEKRMLAMQSVGLYEAVRPIPFPDPRARWGVPPEMGPEVLTQLLAGPRLPGWPSAAQIDREILYNQLNPVRWSWLILLASLLVSIAAWGRQHRVLDVVALGLLLGGLAMMTWGIALRWQVAERIPAANMYESMLFLAWGVGFFAVAAYAILRNRMVVMNAAVMATLTLALTDLLPIDRFIHPVAPVLAGTPWLAIHVPIIMLSYAILALGLVVAHMQIGAVLFAPHKPELVDRMYDLLYWYLFVGSIFLITGIITGSMWAASSWGRYWGWDPKEVWSLVAFLAYMAILHAKLDRLIGKFGVAVISIVAFQTILMTYLGVNFVLSTGMHSYGMGDSPVALWMVLVALAEAAFLTWGIVVYRQQGTDRQA